MTLHEIERRLWAVPLSCKKCGKPAIPGEKCEWADRAGRTRIYQVHDWHRVPDYPALAREVARMVEEARAEQREADAKRLDDMAANDAYQYTLEEAASALRSQR